MEIINLIIPLFILIFLGYTLKKTNFLPEIFGDYLNKFVYYIALPVMLFLSTSQSNIKEIEATYIILAVTITISITVLLSYIASLNLKKIQGPFIQASFRSNMAYLGIPIVATAFGEEALGIAAIAIFTGVILNTLLSIFILNYFQEQKKSIKIKELFLNPLMISIVTGLIISYSNINIPIILANTFELISRVSLPLILIVIGYSLSFKEINKHITADFISATIKLTIMPAIAYVILKIMNVDLITLNTIVLLTAMPTAVVSQTFAKEMKSDSKFAASAVNLSTLLAIISITAIIKLLS
ncbi:MAG: AEC family transporter [Candidatus Woesearchaeota archaeon]